MRLGVERSVSVHSSSNPSPRVVAMSARISGSAADRSGRWNTTRWKYAPPRGSSEYWSKATMLPPWRAISAETAAMMPGVSLPCTMRQA